MNTDKTWEFVAMPHKRRRRAEAGDFCNVWRRQVNTVNSLLLHKDDTHKADPWGKAQEQTTVENAAMKKRSVLPLLQLSCGFEISPVTDASANSHLRDRRYPTQQFSWVLSRRRRRRCESAIIIRVNMLLLQALLFDVVSNSRFEIFSF